MREEFDMTDIETKIRDLETRRAQLIERLESIEQDYRRGLDKDAEEQAIQLENAEVLEGIARSARDELTRVEAELAALRRR